MSQNAQFLDQLKRHPAALDFLEIFNNRIVLGTGKDFRSPVFRNMIGFGQVFDKTLFVLVKRTVSTGQSGKGLEIRNPAFLIHFKHFFQVLIHKNSP